MTEPSHAANSDWDVVVIGGGFYGAVIATWLAQERGLSRVALLEREPALFQRASSNNQARVHNGYHYPRSFTTAFRSRMNLPRFVDDWADTIRRDFTAVYAISQHHSKVTARQFERFSEEIGARLTSARPSIRSLFDPQRIEAVYEADECVFDASLLAERVRAQLDACGVQVLLDTEARDIDRSDQNGELIVAVDRQGVQEHLACRRVINATYSGLNRLGGGFRPTSGEAGASLKHELTEMALVRVPDALSGLGITVMDGPFFSLMPFPPRNLHSLSHVRYTPHLAWDDTADIDPYEQLRQHHRQSNAERMIRDAARYVPLMAELEPVDSLFEIKTVLQRTERNDARPVLFEAHDELPGCYSVLGGKIDNIYDVLEKLGELPFQEAP